MLCVLCLIVIWGFSLVTSYSGVKGVFDYQMETVRIRMQEASHLRSMVAMGMLASPRCPDSSALGHFMDHNMVHNLSLIHI